MPRHDLATHTLPITDLRPHPRNARNGDTDVIAESLQANGQYRPIVTTKDGTILAGNHTYMAAMELGWDTIDVVVLDVDPNSDEAIRIMLADNRTADLGKYDDALLAELLQGLDTLEGSGYAAKDVSDLLEALNPEQPYTDLVNVPQYEPVGPPPPVGDLYRTRKADELITAIDDAEAAGQIPADVATYLRAAAQRHVVFDYRAAAEFYPHASPEVQKLMEDSALVIIDVDDAIRNGYVRLADVLDDQLEQDRGW